MKNHLLVGRASIILMTLPLHAEAPWSCALQNQTAGVSITMYQVIGSELKDLSSEKLMKSFGVDNAALSYKVLQNTPFGIIAATTQASAPDGNGVSVWTSIILINKKTGAMRALSFSTENPSSDESIGGHCEQG